MKSFFDKKNIPIILSVAMLGMIIQQNRNVLYVNFTDKDNLSIEDIKKQLYKNDIVFIDESESVPTLKSKKSKLNDEVENSISIDKYSTYYYKEEGKLKKGELYSSEYASEEEKINRKRNVVNNYATNGFGPDLNLGQDNSPGGGLPDYEPSTNWEYSEEYRWETDLTMSNGSKIGDYCEFVQEGQFNSQEYVYRLFKYRSYITPSATDDRIKTKSLKYDFDPKINPNSSVELVDYSPSSKGASANISLGFNMGANISDSGISGDISLSFSYSALVESPTISTFGNMRESKGGILFEYTNYYYNSGEFYEYSRNESRQEALFVYRVPKTDHNEIRIKDVREIEMFCDYDGWNDDSYSTIKTFNRTISN